MLNHTGAALVTAAAALLIAGIPNGNLFLSSLALIPLVALAAGQASPRVRVQAEPDVPDRAMRVAEAVPVEVRYHVRGGQGTLVVHQPLPDQFELAKGSNILLLRKGWRSREGKLRFKVRCRRRGHFDLPPLQVELLPSMHLTGTVRAEGQTSVTMEFRPDLTRFRRMPGGRMLAKQFLPQDDQARVGIRTADFRDLRDYQRGDPPKTINWHATARRASMRPAEDAMVPLVNEYEAEGQRNVWIFLDCGPAMAVGSNVQNAFEAGVQAAGSIAQFFVDRGFRVGFSLYNRDEPMHLYPDAGRRQMIRIETTLHGTEPSNRRGQLGAATHRVRPFLRGGSTWVVVVTRGESMDEHDRADLRRLRNITAHRRRGSRVLLISPDPYGMVPVEDGTMAATRALQAALDRPQLDAIRLMGIRLIHWDPAQRPLHAHLVGAVR